MKQKTRQELNEIVGPLLAAPELERLKRLRHHRHTNRYQHILRVTALSFTLAKRLGLDVQATARGALLHDLFYHDQTCRPVGYRGPAVLHHPEEALENAKKLTQLTKKEENIILSHMWPASSHLPHSREAWLVDAVDTLVAVADFFHWRAV